MTKQHHVFGDFLLVKRGAVQAKQHAPGREEHNIWELNYIALGGGSRWWKYQDKCFSVSLRIPKFIEGR